ncbi:unnamed protein product [Leptidea sinapis]|uniref:Phosphoinositide-specific phospholipase C EF-hand-like domain-containing protein n=1 Tax=Leptidea sinapis TaxID=189913 RepID=A0A5E4QXR5_9NEOP|nr:unnamed protein product [Leptidea sinapis]
MMRSELRDIFEQLAVPRARCPALTAERSRSSPELSNKHTGCRSGVLTRNGSLDLELTSDKAGRRHAFDVLAAAALPGAAWDSSGRVVSLPTLSKFCESRQHEPRSEQQLRDIVQRHEPDPTLRAECCLSFEGFVRFLSDEDNYAFVPELPLDKLTTGNSQESHTHLTAPLCPSDMSWQRLALRECHVHSDVVAASGNST